MTAPEAPRHPTPPHPLAEDVARAVSAATVKGGSTAELEGIVRAYARALKTAEVPPEQALKRVKDVVRTPPPTHAPATPAERLSDAVVTWFVAEYYRVD